MLDIQRVGIESSNDLVALWTKTFEQAYAGVHTEENIAAYCTENFSVDSAVAELSSEKTVCCFGFSKNKACGFYLVKHINCPIPLKGQSSELKQIYILASEYGSGLGRLLYEHCIESIKANDSDWVWLVVSDINYRAQKFYKKLGFVKQGVGPVLQIGTDSLTSSVFAHKL